MAGQMNLTKVARTIMSRMLVEMLREGGTSWFRRWIAD
jgi:hypothetical protein